MAQQDREDHIRERAYQIWEKEGRPDGAHERHWQQASDEWDAAEKAYREEGPASLGSNESGVSSGLQPGGTTPGGGQAPGADAIGASPKLRKSA